MSFVIRLLIELWQLASSFFTSLPTTVVVDHMGTPDVSKGVDHPQNQRFHKLMETHRNFWVKVTCPERMTIAGPPYDDVVPFARLVVEQFPMLAKEAGGGDRPRQARRHGLVHVHDGVVGQRTGRVQAGRRTPRQTRL